MTRPAHGLMRPCWAMMIFLVPVLMTFVACWDHENLWFPAFIENAPEWLENYQGYPLTVSSSWSTWPGKNHPLADILLPQQADKGQDDGYYQIVFYGADHWRIRFSDGSSSDFKIWLGAVQGSDSIKIPQPDPDIFEFEGKMLNSIDGGLRWGVESPSEIVASGVPYFFITVHYELIEETDGYRGGYRRCRFKIALDDGSVLFDTEVTSPLGPWLKENERPSWLPSGSYYAKDTNEYGPYSISTTDSIPDYVFRIGNAKHVPKTNFFTALRQDEIDNQQRRVLYSVYGIPPDSSSLYYYIEVHRNTQSTVVFRFMDKNKNVLEEGTGWIARQEDLDTW